MTPAEFHEINTTRARCRQLRMAQIIFAGAAAIATLALFGATRPDTTQSVLAAGSVRRVDGGFATDEISDQIQQQAQQLAEQQNEMAEQQFEQGMQQAQMDEQQANNR